LITMAPPAAVSNPRPPMGVWVGASGKLDWAKIIVEKNYRYNIEYQFHTITSKLLYNSIGITGIT